MTNIFYPIRKGSWIPYDYKKRFVNRVSKHKPQNTKAIIVPHAGYEYCGDVLVETYSRIELSNQRVILLCTLHKSEPYLFLPSFTNINYDDQMIAVDTKIVQMLSNVPGFKMDPGNKFFKEHSFEMQLPFLAGQNIQLVPILVGNYDNFNFIAQTLKSINAKIIVTTDFTHYGRNFGYYINKGDIRGIIHNKDMRDITAIITNKSGDFIGHTVCGKHALELFMTINPGWKGELVKYKTSSDLDRFIVHSVSYAGIAFEKELAGGATSELVKLPRECLTMLGKSGDLSGSAYDKFDRIIKLYGDKLRKYDNIPKKGIFITFEDNGMLQGCIGIFYNEAMNLRLNIAEIIILFTLKTIFEDVRFSMHMLKSIDGYQYLENNNRYNFKVNFLEPERSVPTERFYDEYQPCIDGITLEYFGASATFLPNVMLEQKWIDDCGPIKDKERFEAGTFGSLLRKARGHKINYNQWRKSKISLYKGLKLMNN